MPDKLMSVKELAEYLSLDEQTIYRKVSMNEIPYKKAGKIIRFNQKEVDEWLTKK